MIHTRYDIPILKEPVSSGYLSATGQPEAAEHLCPRLESEGAIIPNEAEVVTEFLAHEPSVENPAGAVIENQLRYQRACLLQLLALIKQREQLSARNIAELSSRLQQCQAQLYCLRINQVSPHDVGITRLQSNVTALEDQICRERIRCWSDTAELKQKLLQVAAEHKAALQRRELFWGDRKERQQAGPIPEQPEESRSVPSTNGGR